MSQVNRKLAANARWHFPRGALNARTVSYKPRESRLHSIYVTTSYLLQWYTHPAGIWFQNGLLSKKQVFRAPDKGLWLDSGTYSRQGCELCSAIEDPNTLWNIPVDLLKFNVLVQYYNERYSRTPIRDSIRILHFHAINKFKARQ